MKLFFAFRLHGKLQQRLLDFTQRFQEWQMPARWVHPDDWHVTLAYLGECPADELAQLCHDVDLLLSAVTYPNLQINGVAAFAGKHWPRIVYASVADEEGICADLHGDLLDICRIKERRSYVPHITLCRPDGLGADHTWMACLDAMRSFTYDGPLIQDLALLESVPGSEPRYRCVNTWECIGDPV